MCVYIYAFLDIFIPVFGIYIYIYTHTMYIVYIQYIYIIYIPRNNIYMYTYIHSEVIERTIIIFCTVFLNSFQ